MIQRASAKLRSSAPFAAALAGASVCLAGGEAQALSGSFAASHSGQSYRQAAGAPIGIFNYQVKFGFTTNAGFGYISDYQGSLNFVQNGTFVLMPGTGFNVNSLTSFVNSGVVPGSQINVYLPMRFNLGAGFRYGWMHCLSTNAGGTGMTMGAWSYNASGGSIATLDESMNLKQLPLSNGRVKLHWSNTNEEGVARYEVQAKSVDDTWREIDSNTPGVGAYTLTVAGDGEYRLLIEKSDGTVRSVTF